MYICMCVWDGGGMMLKVCSDSRNTCRLKEGKKRATYSQHLARMEEEKQTAE